MKVNTDHMRNLPEWQKFILRRVNLIKLILSIPVLFYAVLSLVKVIPFSLTAYLFVIVSYVLIPKIYQHIAIKKHRSKDGEDDEGAL